MEALDVPDVTGRVYTSEERHLVLVTTPAAYGMSTLVLTPAEARRWAEMLLGAAEKLEPSS